MSCVLANTTQSRSTPWLASSYSQVVKRRILVFLLMSPSGPQLSGPEQQPRLIRCWVSCSLDKSLLGLMSLGQRSPWTTVPWTNVATPFVEFIGFMVCKTTGSISPLFLLKKIAKKCLVFRDFYTSLIIFLHLFCKYLWLQNILLAFFSARMIVISSRSFCIP